MARPADRPEAVAQQAAHLAAAARPAVPEQTAAACKVAARRAVDLLAAVECRAAVLRAEVELAPWVAAVIRRPGAEPLAVAVPKVKAVVARRAMAAPELAVAAVR